MKWTFGQAIPLSTGELCYKSPSRAHEIAWNEEGLECNNGEPTWDPTAENGLQKGQIAYILRYVGHCINCGGQFFKYEEGGIRELSRKVP